MVKRQMKTIQISGDIVPNDYEEIYDWLGWDCTSPKSIQKVLNDASGDALEVIVNSPGGDVWSGSTIYTLLKEYPGQVEVNIVGLAASAATLIAMAGDIVRMSPSAQFMIHNAAMTADGNKHDLAHAQEILEVADAGVRNAYRLKTGLSDEELTMLMNQETWMSPQMAKEKGFIDEVMFEEDVNQVQLVASVNRHFLSKEKVQLIKNKIIETKSRPPEQKDEASSLHQKQQLALLKLKIGGKTYE